ncbi:hypothetical protein FJV41_32850 [Myxococcus llanfairpwllgwyngyllgogerychwyrndrobwllllantysiliogogogochensis]|uniref:Uncharacterized protein n=1 Tax=Myxococcus llanfairpwllgwyngyllgogerychwyrndrobwllllantysiliogogogochensis TaxID=2590453 RepID=A0A540WRQ5_9BACT|nr:hypothetical protein [Myxococcus llanfairpwllgwyngyllgogerychwyrndrobwllllantysiliogogogochensis]TQF11706.1 hypothetical protein FJV41_32850 [Myxococcus llanfairpwllgwyngyllgogerychwyrndrobwllllantysiliogogogochensis]
MSGHRTLAQRDRALVETGRVDRDLFVEFDGAYGYNAATPMSWLLGRLTVLARRLATGRSLSLYDPVSGAQQTVESMEQFKGWMDRHFPDTWS